jgi:diguanylate cyclase (GGDEF)-like protein
MSLPRERLYQFRGLLLAAVALIGIVTAAMAYTVWKLRSDAIEDAYDHTGNLATVLAEQISQTIRTIDIVIGEIQERVQAFDAATPDDLRRVMTEQHAHVLLKSRKDRLVQADVITIIDARGRLLASSRNWPSRRIDLSDREYFRHFAASTDTRTFISLPVANRATGTPTVFFARPIRGEQASLLGLIVVGVPISMFQGLYETIGLLSDYGFTLARNDGQILARHPDVEEAVGQTIPPGSIWHGIVAQGGGKFRSRGVLFSGPRLVSVRTVPGYPLAVGVGIYESAALAAWRQRSAFIAGGTLMVFICAWVLLSAVGRRVHDLQVSEQSLAERSRELHSAKVQIDAAVNTITHGISMFDADQKLILCNRRYVEIYGLSPDVVKPGCSFRGILEHRKSLGGYAADIDQQVAANATRAAQGKSFTHTATMPNGRIIAVVANPTADGGWVATHEDITERHRAEALIMHMATHDALTDLLNRSAFEHQLKEALRRLHRHGESFALLILDLDKFKLVNDTLGHPAGDSLLREVAERMRRCVRDVDAAARLGGDEFAIVQTRLDDPEHGARRLANRLLDEMRVPVRIGANEFRIGFSIGIALAPADGNSMEGLLRHADLALYRAKAEGRSRLRFYDASLDEANEVDRSRRTG